MGSLNARLGRRAALFRVAFWSSSGEELCSIVARFRSHCSRLFVVLADIPFVPLVYHCSERWNLFSTSVVISVVIHLRILAKSVQFFISETITSRRTSPDLLHQDPFFKNG
jgi:hypothetical protein